MKQYKERPDDRVDPYWDPEKDILESTIFDLLVQSISHVEFENKCKQWNLPYVIKQINDKWIGMAQIEEQYLEVYFMY